MGLESYFKDIVELIKKKKPNKRLLNNLKIKLCSKHNIKKIPTDIEILLNADKKDISKIKEFLLTKPTRTISGVAVAAIMTQPFICPHVKGGIGPCTMCPGGPESVFGSVPQSYTGKEPATRRAIRNQYDPYLQVFNRLEQYVVSGHVPEKIELIIMGGTFPSFDKVYRDLFISYALKAMNDFGVMFFKKGKLDIVKFKDFFELPGDIYDPKRLERNHTKQLGLKNKGACSLTENQKINEKSMIRNVALCIETRPDYAKFEHANEMLRLGCTRVEIGVQTVYDSALKKINRGHSVKDSIEATAVLKDLGFKVSYHMMPGLPGVTKKMDISSLKEIFSNEDFKPDMLKIYPCMVMKGTKLYDDWKKGNFKPLTTEEACEIIAELKKEIPAWVRISRVQRDIPTEETQAGVDMTNLRQHIQGMLAKKGIRCRCIRCREAGHNLNNNKLAVNEIKIISSKYIASKGAEFFISAEDQKNDVIFGYCRLRFPGKTLRREIDADSAIVRELHVFSQSVAIGKSSKKSFQHRGIGKSLLDEAENTARENKKHKVVIISGIGAKEYYRKLGYKKEGPYMVKKIF